MKPPYAIGSVPSLPGHANAYRWRSLPRVRRHRASKPQGSSKRVLPWQITMDQLIFASLSHTHYWYEVGMLKVPAVILLVANPARGQLNIVCFFPCPRSRLRFWSYETGATVSSRVSVLIFHTQAESVTINSAYSRVYLLPLAFHEYDRDR